MKYGFVYGVIGFLAISMKSIGCPYSIHSTEAIRQEIKEASVIEDLPLVLSIINTESRFNPEAVSSVGAKGLMQLTPIALEDIKQEWETAYRKVASPALVPSKWDSWFADKCKMPEDIEALLNIPASNVLAGTCYLAILLKRYGAIHYAVAAYNGGHYVVDRIKQGLPINYETANYVVKVMYTYQLCRADGGE